MHVILTKECVCLVVFCGKNIQEEDGGGICEIGEKIRERGGKLGKVLVCED